MNDVVKVFQPRRYKLSIFENGSALTLKSQSPLLSDVRTATFDFPLRDSSEHALSKATDFGGNLVRRVEEQVSGAVSVQLQLYQAIVALDGIYDQSEALEQMEKVIRDICNDAWFEPTITSTLHPWGHEKADNKYVHPFGRLPLRLHEVRRCGQRKLTC